jgi:MYXO-CTERM domain-containing protein
MLKATLKERATTLSKTLLTAGLLGGTALATLGAGSAQAAWDLHEPLGYQCTFAPTSTSAACDFSGTDPTPTPVARPGSGLNPEDKVLTLLGQSGLLSGDTISFTKQANAWELDLDFLLDRSETDSPTGSLDYKLVITDPNYSFDLSQLSTLLSQITDSVAPFTVTKQVYSTPFTGTPILTLTNNEVPSPAGTLIVSGPISGTTIYVRDTWTIPTGSTTIMDAIQNNFTQHTGTPTPGPLPLLGAGAAFGFSRRIRSRISSRVKGARLA